MTANELKRHSRKKTLSTLLTYVLLVAFGYFMIYPILWLFFASLKENRELFTSMRLIPSSFDWKAYLNGWRGFGEFTFGRFIMNSLAMSVPTTLFTCVSSLLVGFGFARNDFPLKKLLFAVMISTLMLPNAVIIVPRYLLFRSFGWLDSYLPFSIPALFACYPFFVFLMVQFLRGIPKELDESGKLDGCGPLGILTRILLPLSKPVVISIAVFQFTWMWEDFFNSLIFITSIRKYTVTLAVRMTLDTMSPTNWNAILAMSVVSIVPCILVFFLAQRYYVEGITMSGLKG